MDLTISTQSVMLFTLAEIYRAPEVILDAGYSYSADIWSLGVMLWDLLEGKKPFKEVDPLQVQGYDEFNRLGRISALLGSPPRKLLEKGSRTHLLYKPDGQFKGTAIAPSNFNFEKSIYNTYNENKSMFVEFVRRMIKWNPDERTTAKELLEDPWLYAEFDED
ncbi:uncharacterized protein KD926_009755 [Aspergillus affinis]|uniref:uncharacterized protein n=1 Tax=Aspergillus affinis TaxID=1070780 RepID=UPI0022FE8460|nr:uncharacterized protein KD926_009755 [Aspergillus affinis]KAI9039313.1 hypothetical protein KD926_009755 [Aspergillus affinis]